MTEDRIYLIYIKECIDNVLELSVQGREALSLSKHGNAAILYYLQTMAESTQRLSNEIKVARPEIEWGKISGFRNRLVHSYLAVNMEIVWDVITNYLPPLKQAVEAMLQTLDDSTSE